jgi:hypothetical protein
LQQGLDILKKKLREKIVDRTSTMTFGPAAHAGYRRQSAGASTIVVHTTAFGDWFANKAQRNAVLGWLATKGLLRRSTAGMGRRLNSNDTKGVLRRWPNGTLVRSFEFADPFPAVKAPQALVAQPKAPANRRIAQNGRGGASKAATEFDPESWPVDENGRRVYAN